MTPSSIPLMQCPIAGFQFHAGESCWPRMQPGDALELHREPGNRHDSRAITVEWNHVMLGYVPREANYALSQMLDRGARVTARVKSLRNGGDPWQRVMMEVVVDEAPPSAPIGAPLPALQQVGLRSGQNLAHVRVVRARLPGPLAPRQQEAAEAALRECVAEIGRRFGARLVGVRGEQTREVVLWDTLRIRIGTDGLGLGACYVADGTPFHHDFVTLDLRQPIGRGIWALCFSPLILSTFARHWKPDLGETKRARRWVRDCVELTFDDPVEFDAVREAALDFLAPDPLARSLTNRVFGRGARVDRFNWLGERLGPVALCGVEQPGMLPFLQVAFADEELRHQPDPLAALRESLAAHGIEPAAWKWLPRWNFAVFHALGHGWCTPRQVASLANLLLAVEAKAPPPAQFAQLALKAAVHDIQTDDDEAVFQRRPAWFMRALLWAAERASSKAAQAQLEGDLQLCLRWLDEAQPSPDANQQHSGWPWMLTQAKAHHHIRELQLLAPWPVPLRSAAIPPAYRAVGSPPPPSCWPRPGR